MKTLSDYLGQPLQFIQPSFFKRVYELRANRELIATVRFPQIFSSLAEVEGFSKKWEIYKPSIWKSDIEIRESGYELHFARFVKEGLRQRGKIELPKGEGVKLIFNLFKSTYELQNDSGVRLVLFKERIAIGDKADVFVEKKSELLDKFPWTVILAWYVALQSRHHAAH